METLIKRTQSFSESNKLNINYNSSVTSIKPECLESLRFPKEKKKKVKNTHLLAYMSEVIPDKEEVKIEEIEQFCSFDRIKKIIEKKREEEGTVYRKKSAFMESKHENDDLSDQVMGVLQIQAKMKKMEANLNLKHNKNRPVTASLGHHLKKGHSKTNSTNFKGQEKKSSQGKVNKAKQQTSNKPQRFSDLFITQQVPQEEKKPLENKENYKSHLLLSRQTIRRKFQENAYDQFGKWQKNIKSDKENSVKNFIEEQIVKKVYNLLEERDIKYNELLKQNKNQEKTILQKNLEIENLKSKQKRLEQTISQLETYREKYSEELSEKKKNHEQFLVNFHEQFCELFPDENPASLRKQVDNIVEKCLNRFQDVENKNYDKWNSEKGQFGKKIDKLEGNIEKLKDTEYELRSNLKHLKYEQNASNLEFDSLLKSKNQLEKLQNKILEMYNDWFSKRSEQQKLVLKNLGLMNGSYEYVEMLSYIAVFRDKLSTDHKVHEYLIKVLRGVERIRKIMFPCNLLDENKGKKDPLIFLEKLERYIKNKVYQSRYNKKQSKNARNSISEEEEFFKDQSQEQFI